MIIVDGKKIAEDIKLDLQARLEHNFKPRLVVVLVGDNPMSANYVRHKQKFGDDLGVEVVVYEYEEQITQAELEQEMSRLADDDNVDGLIVQLPLPSHLDTPKILNLISPAKDIDALGGEATVLSPVVKAVAEIFTRFDLEIKHKKIVVVGDGKLVGRPVAIWLTSLGGEVTQVKSGGSVEALSALLSEADIIISGVGKPNLISSAMIKDGVILIDAATSEVGGKVVGDMAKDCLDKSILFTPVPGGVGPITMAMLFVNLLDLVDSKD